jgi:hypothetical protein
MLQNMYGCPECGASPTATSPDHECDEERRLDFQMFQLRAEIGELMPELRAWLDSPEGKFALWLAERDRAGSPA